MDVDVQDGHDWGEPATALALDVVRSSLRSGFALGSPPGWLCQDRPSIQATLTFSPRGPFGPCPRSNVTACPSRRSSKAVCAHAELWKKYSFPSAARMKPNPLSLTSRLIVPFIDGMKSPRSREIVKSVASRLCGVAVISVLRLCRPGPMAPPVVPAAF